MQVPLQQIYRAVLVEDDPVHHLAPHRLATGPELSESLPEAGLGAALWASLGKGRPELLVLRIHEGRDVLQLTR